MLYFLRKFAEALVLPIGFCGLLIVLAVLLRRRRIALAAVALICLLSTGLMSELLLLPLEHFYKSMPVADAPGSDAIVVLAGGLLRGVNPAGLQWGNSANRFFTGVDLARAQKAKLLVLSSGLVPEDGKRLREVAVRAGVPPDHILVTRRVLTTEDEARTISEFPGIHSILLVTSAFHMPRAALLFRSRGFKVTPFPTDQRVFGIHAGLNAFVPAAGGLENTETALREYYGLVIYEPMVFFRRAPN